MSRGVQAGLVMPGNTQMPAEPTQKPDSLGLSGRWDWHCLEARLSAYIYNLKAEEAVWERRSEEKGQWDERE